MIKVEQALENIENVTTLAEMTDTLLGQTVIERFAACSSSATPKIVRDKILTNYNGALTREFVRVVRAVIKSADNTGA